MFAAREVLGDFIIEGLARLPAVGLVHQLAIIDHEDDRAGAGIRPGIVLDGHFEHKSIIPCMFGGEYSGDLRRPGEIEPVAVESSLLAPELGSAIGPLGDVLRDLRHGGLDDRFRRLEILLEQEGGDGEHVADVVEAVTCIVWREFFFRLEIDPHQVTDRVVIFDAIEPADCHPARIGLTRIAAEDVVLDPIRQVRDLLRVGMGLPRWRHDPGADVLEHRPPEVAILQERLACPHLVECHPTFLRSVGVALIAIIDQDRPDMLLEPRQRRVLRPVTLGRNPWQHKENQDAQPYPVRKLSHFCGHPNTQSPVSMLCMHPAT